MRGNLSFPQCYVHALKTDHLRFSEGRRFWTSVMVLCRNAAQTVCLVTIADSPNDSPSCTQIWHHVPNERPHKTDPALSKPALYGVVEKKSMINLVSSISCSAAKWRLTLFQLQGIAVGLKV